MRPVTLRSGSPAVDAVCAGVRMPRLSLRERREVVHRLTARGVVVREIAERLNVSPRAVFRARAVLRREDRGAR